MASPKPQPTALKMLKGETRKERLNPNEPKPQSIMPDRPEFIKGAALKAWKQYGPMLVRLGVMTEADGLAFAALCVEWARYVNAVGVKDSVQTFASGARQVAPEVSVAHKSLTQLLRLFAEFGLTPSARARLSIEREEEDNFEELINGEAEVHVS